MLLVAGCGGSGKPAARATATPTSTAPPAGASRSVPDTEALDRLLAERAGALAHGDARAYAATAAGAQRTRDRRDGRRAAALRLGSARYRSGPPRIAGDRARLQVDLDYRLRGASGRFVTRRRLVAERTPGGWRVRADRAVRDRVPWEVAAFRVSRAPHVVLLTPAGVDPAPLRAALADAYRRIRVLLPSRDLPRSVLVIGARDAAQTRALAGPLDGLAGLSALSDVAVRQGGPALRVRRVLAQRLVVVLSRWTPLGAVGREQVLVHEMTHTALAADTSGRTPSWLAEAVALHVSGDDRTAALRTLTASTGDEISLRALSRPDSLRRLPGAAQAAAYAVASAAAEAIVARHGTEGLFALYDAFNDEGIPGPPGRRTTDRVMRRTLGMSLVELDAAIAAG